MVSIGNKSMLVKSEYCQKCAKCCKEFSCGGFDLDCALRFLWTRTDKIEAKDTPFRDDFGRIKREVIFKFPCTKLKYDNGKYFCSVWDKERPDFCNTYPDNLFYNIEEWDTTRIQKMLEEGSKDCPALKEVTIEQVQDMLRRNREEK